MATPWGTGVCGKDIFCTARVKSFPGGKAEVLVCDRPIFGGSGWEDCNPRQVKGSRAERQGGQDVARAVRRARAQVRDIARCTPFRWFVTLTLDQNRIDRYDMKAITRHLNRWLDNQVRRKGLAYVLVPERHKDGAIHFHGFFNDALEAVDSGTISRPGRKAPQRPRSARQRAEWLEAGGHPVYNLPGWSWGFTTAIELYGEYDAAVSYVCKYIGKDMEPGASPNGDDPQLQPAKIGGRWYYSGGKLGRPEVTYCDLGFREALEEPGAYRFDLPQAGLSFVQFTVKGGEIGGESGGKVPVHPGLYLPLAEGLRSERLVELPPRRHGAGGQERGGVGRTCVRYPGDSMTRKGALQ